MDGFRERINGKFEHSDKSVSRGSRYERSAGNRTQKKRDDISINDIVNAIEKSNRNQLEKITGLFNDAKVDRLESERSILKKISEKEIKTVKFGEEIKPAPVAAPVVVKSEREDEILQKLNILLAANFTGEKAEETVKDGIADIANAATRSQSIDTATLMRIERLVGQNSETISESEDVINKNYEILRSYVENFKGIETALSEVKSSQEEIVSKLSEEDVANADGADSEVKELVEKTGLDIKASQEEIKELIARVSDTVRKGVMEAAASSSARTGVVPAAVPASPTITMQPDNKSNEEVIDAIKDNRALLNMIRQDLLANVPAASNTEDKEEYLTVEEAQKYFNDLTEHVHVQCVKTYRNVQANMSDQAAQINRNIDKSISELRLFTIASVCLNVVTIVLVICSILGIFS